MGRLFGTDGVRGIYGDTLTDDLARRLAYFGTKVLSKQENPKVVLAMDTRESSPLLENALAEGATLAGAEALLTGVLPTPAVPVLIREEGADFGIVVTASHNPYEYNGIKFFNADGYKLPDALEDKIAELVLSEKPIEENKVGKTNQVEKAKQIYLDFLLDHDHEDLKGYKIALDCSNGATSDIAADYFKNLGAEVIVTGAEPDGKNINRDVGSTNLEHLIKFLTDNQADFGFAFDGDGDRCLAVDENGNKIDGDKILYLISKKLKKQGKLNKDKIVITVMSNLGLLKALDEENISYIRTDVGDKYVLEEMLNNDYNLGGEQSGHIIILDRNSTGDGLLTASVLTDLIVDSGLKASELSNQMRIYPQVLENAKVNPSGKTDYETDPQIKEGIKKLEDEFKDEGRVLIRPSGTEPLVRVMIEGDDLEKMEQQAKDLARLIEEKFPV